ncbi:hypothetical protein VF21_03484 [Pseudogymnoascus sp. 05NY08]|nr:hypothetical protein VF21_03484 [Pseudogymnoascus sp. 05NY08]
MEAIIWDVHSSSEELLVEVCRKAREANGNYSDYGRGYVMVKISDDITVKIGGLVIASEARTQEFANKNADPTIVHVPRVHRFFEREGRGSKQGYLFMEYVQGRTLEEIYLAIRPDIIPRMARIIEHFGQIQGQIPGPIGGGLAQGHIFGDDGADIEFPSVPGFNAYLNKRLAVMKKSIDLTGYPLVLCHMDLCRRNIILRDDDTLSLANWNDAGLYPRFFEIRVLSYLNPWYGPFDVPLEEDATALLRLTKEEERLMDLLRIVRSVNLRAQLCQPYLLRCGHDLTENIADRRGSYGGGKGVS